MRTPVFSEERQILGYLDHEESLARYPQFRRSCCFLRQPAGYGPVASEDPAPVTETSVAFTWSSLSSSRGSTESVFVCRVLIADDVNGLSRISGFLWFAEVHGECKHNDLVLA